MRHIDIIRFCIIIPLAFIFDWLANGSDPTVCLTMALITGVPIALAEIAYAWGRLKELEELVERYDTLLAKEKNQYIKYWCYYCVIGTPNECNCRLAASGIYTKPEQCPHWRPIIKAPNQEEK